MMNMGVLAGFGISLCLPTEKYDENPLNCLWVVILSIQGLFALIQMIIIIKIFTFDTPY